MNEDTLRQQWQQLRSRLRGRWGKLSDHDLNAIDGDREQLIDKIQLTYGKTFKQARKEVLRFERSCGRPAT
jgi:uncharacterized protein YjbJ (UPF0337 family)